MSTPADAHRRVAGDFTATVEGAAPDAWDRPAPVDGWVARDVVGHLVEWFPAFLDGATGITLPAGPSVADDPVGAWRAQTDAVQALLDDPATAEPRVRPPAHRPHVARAGDRHDLHQRRVPAPLGSGPRHRPGRDARPRQCAAMLEGMLPMDEVLRQSGQYGPRVDVPDDADVQTRLLAFIGRTPDHVVPSGASACDWSHGRRRGRGCERRSVPL